MSKINICFSSDNNYAKYMGTAICSILKNAGENDSYNFYILDGGISNETKEQISELKTIKDFSIEYLTVNPDDFKSCPMTGYVNYITLPTYYRFKIASLLPNVDKILYLDGDIIVNSDIKELFDTDIENYYIGAIPEVFNHHHKERLEIFGDNYYFNAGVLLINSKKWREDNIEEKLFTYALNPEREIVFQDQDILNEVLKYNIKYLPLKWNLQHDALFTEESYLYHKTERNEAIKAPKLIHYTHKLKPWNPKCTNKYRTLYYEYLKQTPWKNDYIYIKLGTINFLIGKILKNIISFENITKHNIKHKVLTLFGIKIKLNKQVLYDRIMNEKLKIQENNFKMLLNKTILETEQKSARLQDMLTQIFLEDALVDNSNIDFQNLLNFAKTISVSYWSNDENCQNFLKIFSFYLIRILN